MHYYSQDKSLICYLELKGDNLYYRSGGSDGAPRRLDVAQRLDMYIDTKKRSFSSFTSRRKVSDSIDLCILFRGKGNTLVRLRLRKVRILERLRARREVLLRREFSTLSADAKSCSVLPSGLPGQENPIPGSRTTGEQKSLKLYDSLLHARAADLRQI